MVCNNSPRGGSKNTVKWNTVKTRVYKNLHQEPAGWNLAFTQLIYKNLFRLKNETGSYLQESVKMLKNNRLI